MRLILSAFCLLAVGCRGPLTKPMVDRLDEESQANVDDAWANMFTPADRLDRTLLLDAILAGQLHQYGVDSLRLVSEKHAGDGLVVMEVRFDREDSAFDRFSVTYVDSNGLEVRRERFVREEVEDRVDFLFSPIMREEGMKPDFEEQMQLRAAKREARMEEIRAALAPLYEQGENPPAGESKQD